MRPKTPVPRVLHLLGPLRPSGMERMLVSGAPHFDALGLAGVVVGQGDEHPFSDHLRQAGYEVRTMGPVGISLRNALALRRLVTEQSINVIHIHTERNYLRTILAARLALGTRGGIVRTVHNVFDASGRWKTSRRLQALVGDRLAAAVVVPSPDVQENEKRIGRKTRVIYNWVDDRLFTISEQRANRKREDGGVLVGLIVGNCSPIKHHELALRALAESDSVLIHLGDESDASAEELRLLAELENSGRLLGRGVRPPDASLVEADFFLMPSRHEGMPVALAEALVAGLPALVSDAAGLRWAGGIKGVQCLAQSDDAWSFALTEWGRSVPDVADLDIDFSAVRGTNEYADLYRSAALGSAGTQRVRDR